MRDGSVVRSVVRSLRCGKTPVGQVLCRICFSMPTNFARNSPATVSNIELCSLELQRFWMLLNVHAVELRASFVWLWLWRGCCGILVACAPVAAGGLRDTKPYDGVSSACRALVSCNSPSRSPPAISHAIPLNNLVCLSQYVSPCHLCFGIACDFV